MREKIYKTMKDLMQNNCICNYVFVQNGNETYAENTHALDAYMKAYSMSENGNVECYMAPLGKKDKALHPVFTVINGVTTLSGQVIK